MDARSWMRRLRAGDAIVLTQAGRPAMELAKNAEKTNIAPKIAKLMNAVGSEVAIAEGMAAIDLKRHCNACCIEECVSKIAYRISKI